MTEEPAMTTDYSSGLRHWAPRIAPAICTTTILAAARAWNLHGAEHSMGAAFLMGAFAAGSGAAGLASASGTNGDPAITALAFAGAGTFAMAGVAAYSGPLPLPILLWLIATIAAYAMAARYWRDDRRAETQHTRTRELQAADHDNAQRIEAIRARAAKDVAETTRDAAQAAQMLAAWQHRQMLDVHPDLAGLDYASKLLLGDEEKQTAER
jgi:hypothetical protein